MHIAVLGCGPSGLVAAHAARRFLGADGDVTIFSQKVKSPIFGAQYLHQPIPGTNSERVYAEVIRYKMAGSPEAYLRKVYGDAWDGTVNDDMRDQAHMAWDLRATYDELWREYFPVIRDVFLPSDEDEVSATLGVILDEFDMVFNTLPRPVVCTARDVHRFNSTKIWAAGQQPERDFPIPAQDNVILYNGDSEPGFYRLSRIFGYSTVEYPGHLRKPPVPGVARVSKPLSHSCDCWTREGDRFHHLGRMGRWQHGRLVHHVYADTVEQLLLANERSIA